MKNVEKLKKNVKEGKKFLIVIGVLWVVLAIVLVSPIAYSIGEAINENGNFNIVIFINNLVPAITSFTSIFKIFSTNSPFNSYLKDILLLLLFCRTPLK